MPKSIKTYNLNTQAMHSYFQKITVHHPPVNSYQRDVLEVIKAYDQTLLNEIDLIMYRNCFDEIVEDCKGALPFGKKITGLEYKWSKNKKKEPILEIEDFLTVHFYLLNESAAA